ncbi:hypothetical protein [Bradyrhizobium sp. Tv2a-2]|uniref:hypothetical protein n=1 Tax=Bradyrhizobium sp. Tv2a-2 TaxID=113395 RepID=UPI00041A2C45|nr:hypothetical protein [Bradyrhizobium sp. Tv2a-2]
MGLDITAYTRLTKIENPTLDEDGFYDDGFQATASVIEWTEQNWPGRTAGIETGAVYDCADSFGFRAGSYSGYNAWREQLAKMAGYPLGHYDGQVGQRESHCVACWNGQTGPFAELINFADNEGTIGPVVSAKLAKDFAEHQEKAEQWAQSLLDGDWFIAKYRDWRKAFEMASDNGAVDFH